MIGSVRHGVEQVRILDQVGVAERGDRHLRLVDQLLVDARGLAVGQHLGGDMQRIRVRVPVIGDVMRYDNGRERPRGLEGDAPFLGLRLVPYT